LDLGSGSGTFVNGVRRAMSTLLDGDRLTVGATDFAVQII
jgi:pSer/pThr/pTyr-binding forkhead associated (FHA) protein